MRFGPEVSVRVGRWLHAVERGETRWQDSEMAVVSATTYSLLVIRFCSSSSHASRPFIHITTEDSAHTQSTDGANAGLEHARALLDPIHAANPWISYADLWSESTFWWCTKAGMAGGGVRTLIHDPHISLVQGGTTCP